MNILFVRHGETEHNVARLIAGSTDSKLTDNGTLQAKKLGRHLVDSDVCITHVYSSDLQRAFETARLILDPQFEKNQKKGPPIVKTRLLRERDFGSDEGAPYNIRAVQKTAEIDNTTVPWESIEAMEKRALKFLSDFIMPLLAADTSQGTIVIVGHGLFLGILWRSLLQELEKGSITLSLELDRKYFDAGIDSLKNVKEWANTGYSQISVRRTSGESQATPCSVAGQARTTNASLCQQSTTFIQKMNCVAHLN
jgi:broad specificity phosphatase PhoE